MKGNYSTMEVDGITVHLLTIEKWPYPNIGKRAYWVMDGEVCLGTVIRQDTQRNQWRVSYEEANVEAPFSSRHDAIEYIVRAGRTYEG